MFNRLFGSNPRVGVIFHCPQNDLYHNRCDIIITSQMAVSDMANYDDDNVQTLGNVFYPCTV